MARASVEYRGAPGAGANTRGGRRPDIRGAGRRAILAGHIDREVTMTATPKPSLSPEVLTQSVWDAVKDVPGVHDLYRKPLQILGERVHIDRYGPVRLEEDDDGYLLEVHLVATPDTHLPTLGDAVGRASLTYLARTTGTPIERVRVCIDDLALASDDE